MNKFLSLILLVFVYCSCNAQKLNYGIEVGYLSNNLSVDKYQSKSKNGFLIGSLVEMDINKRFSIESGISFTRRAGKIKGDYLLGTELSKVEFSQMDYLRIPLTAGYKFKIHDFSIRPGIGAYYAVGINGDSFVSGIDNFGQPYEARVSTFSNGYGKPYRPCNRNDAGLLFSLNANYRHIGIKLSYDVALTNTSYYGNGKHRSLIVSLAYWLK